VGGVAGEPPGAGAGGVVSGVAGLGAAGGVVADEPGAGAGGEVGSAGGVTGEVEAGGVGLSVGCVVIRPEYWTAA
jgi:hypothetical protein